MFAFDQFLASKLWSLYKNLCGARAFFEKLDSNGIKERGVAVWPDWQSIWKSWHSNGKKPNYFAVCLGPRMSFNLVTI